MTKIGRNAVCPCGSGKKYKKCHGNLEQLDRMAAAMKAAPPLFANLEAKERQRADQQGLGRPIIAAKMENGHQFVAVNNRLFYSENWKTFHDFLGDYLKQALGPTWGTAELQKPLEQLHPILLWYQKLCEQQRIFIKEPGTVATGRMTGAVAAYMHLAYDLYALDHNAELQAKLVERLRNRDNFWGARYEVRVAATLARAGFSIAFENEDDRSSSHCEFTATHSISGRSFSVEAKRSESGRFTRQIVRALKKDAKHLRIVFVDLNMPDASTGDEIPPYMRRAFNLLRRFEALDPQAQRLPPAYIFLTNTSWEHHLDSFDYRALALADGFHISEFKIDHEFPSLREAINAREAHTEMHQLMKSIRTHSNIPVTFDGEVPEFAFGEVSCRLTIGSRYAIPGPDNTKIEGVLTSATVLESDKMAACTFSTRDGKQFLFRKPLSADELQAWRRHPDTFFGEISQQRKAESVLDLYDIFFETYSGTPKAKLLEFMKNAGDIEHLGTLSQLELASVFCERSAAQAFSTMTPGPKPLLHSTWRRPPT